MKAIALQRGFKATLEEETLNGRVDVGLRKNDLRIAIEISVTNTSQYEVQNIQKCIDADYNLIFIISENEKHLSNIKILALKNISKKFHNQIHFFTPNKLSEYLDATQSKNRQPEKRVRGYRINVNYSDEGKNSTQKQSLTNIIMQALQKKK